MRTASTTQGRAPGRRGGVLACALALLLGGGALQVAASAPAAADLAGPAGVGDPSVVPLAHGHSHNDYDQLIPLVDAIEHGFTSIEVDVFLVGTRLLIGHDIVEAILDARNLRSSYLEPLSSWVAANSGGVYGPDAPGVTLVVDIKSEAGSTYAALERELEDYRAMLTRVDGERATAGPVTVLVSGNRPVSLFQPGPDRLAALDGRVADLDPAIPAATMPLISARWGDHIDWDGTGKLPARERAKLRSLVRDVHAEGRRIRFFDTPDATPNARNAVWRAETAARVDLLNVDDLDAGQAFLLDQPRPSRPYVPTPGVASGGEAGRARP